MKKDEQLTMLTEDGNRGGHDPDQKTRSQSHTDRILDSIEWSIYKESVFDLLIESVEAYSREYTDKIYQLSVWTDPQACITAVNFETKEHAGAKIQEHARIWRELGEVKVAQQVEARPYNNNPAEFRFAKFRTKLHDALSPMRTLNFSVRKQVLCAERCIHKNLLQTTNAFIESGALSRLPSEPTIWVGISSSKSWYDNVVGVKIRE